MFSLFNGVAFTALSIIVIIPFWKIFQKAGFPPLLSLFVAVPILNLLTLYYVAFSRWPSE
jgi:hypothetical protein